MPKLDAGQRRALKLLADAADGWTEALLLAYGLSAGLIADLVGAGLATAKAERMYAGGRPVEVTRIRITIPPAQSLRSGSGLGDLRLVGAKRTLAKKRPSDCSDDPLLRASQSDSGCARTHATHLRAAGPVRSGPAFG
jgi:hypothetical protein